MRYTIEEIKRQRIAFNVNDIEKVSLYLMENAFYTRYYSSTFGKEFFVYSDVKSKFPPFILYLFTKTYSLNNLLDVGFYKGVGGIMYYLPKITIQYRSRKEDSIFFDTYAQAEKVYEKITSRVFFTEL